MLSSSQSYKFPDNFLWGAATASHQVEGGNRWNDWWEYEQDGRLPHKSGEACRHFQLYESDFDLARTWNHNAHRMSIEWSRIEPIEGEWNEQALAHYERVILALRQRSIEPLVTLHHFTNPQWFQRRGGWERSDCVETFLRYVKVVVRRLGATVKWWVTINEPTVYAKRAYVIGDWPPCKRNSLLLSFRVMRNMCRAHTAAYCAIHEMRSDAMVGLAHSAPWVEPFDPQRMSDRLVARARNFVLNGFIMRLLGPRPRRVLDFIGINYYVRQLVQWQPRGMAMFFGSEKLKDPAADARHFSPLGGEIWAAGLRHVLVQFSRYRVPLVVTENGLATANEADRAAFISGHVAAVGAALRDGADVRGYLYWTLYDNFEWALGYGPTFGLAAVDRATQARIPRPAAALLAQIAGNNSLTGMGEP